MATTSVENPSAKLDSLSAAGGKRSVFDMFRLDGRVAVITSGARCLGYSMAEGLCAAGLSGIAVLDVQSDLGERACERLHSEYGVNARFYRLDVRDEVLTQDAMNFAIRDLGRIGILILSAGVADIVEAEKYSPEKFRE
ncbi:hypothetical protein V1506DRAFT_321112 [Lipomyces tetrasporus]